MNVSRVGRGMRSLPGHATPYGNKDFVLLAVWSMSDANLRQRLVAARKKGPPIVSDREDSPNPYKAPTESSGQHSQEFEALQRPGDVERAGRALLIVASLCVFVMLSNVVFWGQRTMQPPREDDKIFMFNLRFPTFMVAYAGVITIYNVILMAGALSMMRRRSYAWSLTATCLAIVPVLGPCWVLGIPYGIWGLSELRKPGVRESFRSVQDTETG